MALTINTNMQSLNAQRNLGTSQSSLSTSMQRLSSGLRVNSSKDDAAGLAIADRMNTQVRGMNVAIRNANDAISLSQTAEGGLGKIGDAFQRMRELAVQSANGTNKAEDRANLQAEFAELQAEVTRLVDSTQFNGMAVLKSTAATTFQVGAGTTADQRIAITATDLSAAASATVTATTAYVAGTPATGTGIGGADATAATAAINAIDAALTQVTTERAKFGAAQNRFESVVANLQISSENQSAARGRIMDADFASETANLSRAQVLQQAGTAMVAQANQLPQGVLALLR